MPKQSPNVEAQRLAADGAFPNNRDLPLLVYRGVLGNTGTNAAEEFEQRLQSNGWGGAWRNGVFPYHHYHSNAHEVLCVCSGSAVVQFGGPSGPTVTVGAGDVAILPAGTAHKRLEASPDFLVVGAYPQGQENMDLIRDQPEEKAAAEKRIATVPLPQSDPVYGPTGPLREYWVTT